MSPPGTIDACEGQSPNLVSSFVKPVQPVFVPRTSAESLEVGPVMIKPRSDIVPDLGCRGGSRIGTAPLDHEPDGTHTTCTWTRLCQSPLSPPRAWRAQELGVLLVTTSPPSRTPLPRRRDRHRTRNRDAGRHLTPPVITIPIPTTPRDAVAARSCRGASMTTSPTRNRERGEALRLLPVPLFAVWATPHWASAAMD